MKRKEYFLYTEGESPVQRIRQKTIRRKNVLYRPGEKANARIEPKRQGGRAYRGKDSEWGGVSDCERRSTSFEKEMDEYSE